MINIKSQYEIDLMRKSGQVTGYILYALKDFIKPGISTMDIDRFAEKIIRENGMIPTFKGYMGYPANVCASINEEIVHGIPSETRILKEGDIISVDVGSTYKGYVSDAARTYPVGEVSDLARDIMYAAKRSFFEGLKFCKPGCRLTDISHAIQKSVEGDGYGVVRDLVGHGVGKQMHEEPQILNYGRAGRGPRLAKGMTFAIEPMITEGSYEIVTLDDDWTIVTEDGGLAAHYENSIVITDGEPEILTIYEK